MKNWPPLIGDYIVNNPEGWIALATLNTKPESFTDLLHHVSIAILGSVKTENLGVEKTIVNVITNPNIRYLVLYGEESKGHYPGDALIKLVENGVDGEGRIVGARGAIPYLENIRREWVEHFRQQILEVVDLVGNVSVSKIEEVLTELEKEKPQQFPKKVDVDEVLHTFGHKTKDTKRCEIYSGKSEVIYLNEITILDPLTFKINMMERLCEN